MSRPEHPEYVIGCDGKRYPSTRRNPDLPGQVRALRDRGHSIRDIATELGISVGSVHHWIHNERAEPRNPPIPREAGMPALNALAAAVEHLDRTATGNTRVDTIRGRICALYWELDGITEPDET